MAKFQTVVVFDVEADSYDDAKTETAKLIRSNTSNYTPSVDGKVTFWRLALDSDKDQSILKNKLVVPLSVSKFSI